MTGEKIMISSVQNATRKAEAPHQVFVASRGPLVYLKKPMVTDIQLLKAFVNQLSGVALTREQGMSSVQGLP